MRRPLLVLAMFALPFALVACGSDKGDPKQAHVSAGGLPESRLPVGPRGDSPPPTAAVPRDFGPKGLEAGWYKRAERGEKAPTAGDRPSM